MKRPLFLSLLFIIAVYHPGKELQGENRDLKVEADDSWTNGQQLILQGNVFIEQEHATLEAQEASLIRTQNQRVEEIELHHGIQLHFKDGSSFSCEHAFIQFTPEMNIARINASGNVQISHKNRLQTSSEQAIYLCNLPKQPPHALIAAIRLDWWTVFDSTRIISSFLYPIPKASGIDSSFAYDLLILREHVRVEHPELGTLVTDGDVQILQTVADQGAVVERIATTGATTIVFRNQTTNQNCLLSCYGKVILDNKSNRIYLDSYREGDRILREQQVSYKDDMGGVQADSMIMDFEWQEGRYSPAKVLISGNVQIINGENEQTSQMPLQLQYALADWVEYFPDSEIMTLCALEGRRVLFLDKKHDSKVSANKVIFRRKERMMEGVGGVRFNLSQIELDRFKDVFGF